MVIYNMFTRPMMKGNNFDEDIHHRAGDILILEGYFQGYILRGYFQGDILRGYFKGIFLKTTMS